MGFGLHNVLPREAEWHWKDHPQGVKDAYANLEADRQDPE